MSQGNIILLNGASSSGKTTIAQALQEVMETPYLHTGIDQFLIERLPKRLIVYGNGIHPTTAEGWLIIFRDKALSEVRIGPIGYQWIAGMYRAIAELADEGLDVIVDDIIYDQRVLKIAVQTLPVQQVYFVGIRCPLEVAESREEARGNRAKGGARTSFNLVHVHGVYDLEVDSATYSPMECAMQIKSGLETKPDLSAFSQLKALG